MKSGLKGSLAVVVASMTLAMPMLIGMVHLSTMLSSRGLIYVAVCFAVWAIAATYLIVHFTERARDGSRE